MYHDFSSADKCIISYLSVRSNKHYVGFNFAMTYWKNNSWHLWSAMCINKGIHTILYQCQYDKILRCSKQLYHFSTSVVSKRQSVCICKHVYTEKHLQNRQFYFDSRLKSTVLQNVMMWHKAHLTHEDMYCSCIASWLADRGCWEDFSPCIHHMLPWVL